MCAIVGAVLRDPTKYKDLLQRVIELSQQRGNDSFGYVWLSAQAGSRSEIHVRRYPDAGSVRAIGGTPKARSTFIAQLRAEPTHEFVAQKTALDVAPFASGDFWVAHNGTVANDLTYSDPAKRTTCIDSESIANRLAEIGCAFNMPEIWGQLREIDGSFGLIIGSVNEPGRILVATNYKPIYYLKLPGDDGFVLASQRSYLAEASADPFPNIEPVPQNSIMTFAVSHRDQVYSAGPYPDPPWSHRTLLLFSGGLDATVAAAKLVAQGREVTLLNYCYGQRAQGPEMRATQRIAELLECKYLTKSLDIGVSGRASKLLNTHQSLSVGSEGAELPHEWVPARNLVMISHAVALAEELGHDAIALGVNLEESNSYPDNEMEFVNRFNELLPYAVAPNKRIEILMPVGHMMKRQIIETGQMLNAPMEHSYSCYSGDEIHCGVCASCYLRRAAFRIAGVHDLTLYKSGVTDK